MSPERSLHLRITLVSPPRGVPFALQRGREEIETPRTSTGGAIGFELLEDVKEMAKAELDFRGPHVQGTRGGRFVYICSGQRAGQPGSVWDRRAKVRLRGITPLLIRAVREKPRGLLEARIAGAAKDGGPACASVVLLDGGWRLSR